MKSAKLKKLNFLFIAVLFIVSVLFPLFFADQASNFWAIFVSTILIFIFALWHALIKFGFRNTLIFLGLVAIISFVSEYIGVNFGYSFGGGYYYTDYLKPAFFKIPVLVFLMWVAIIYIAYQIAEHITDYRFTKKISLAKRAAVSFFTAVFAALATVAWDLTLDPLATKSGWWVWQELEASKGFLGVPFGNFIGWMLVSFAVVFIFKVFFEKESLEKESIFEFSPLVAYLLLWITNFVWALSLGQIILAVVSIITMWPFILLLVIRAVNRYYKLPKQYKS